MSVLLVVPEFKGAKFGGVHCNILYLATFLQRSGHETFVVDLTNPDMTVESFERLVRRERPTVVGITSTSPTHLDACWLACSVKQIASDTLIVKGGKHDSFAWETTLDRHKEIDFVVVGDGEVALERLVSAAEKREGFKDIPGLAYRVNGTVRANTASDVAYESLPMPDRTLIPHHPIYDFKIFGGKRTAQTMTVRGCPYTCNFCHVGQKVNTRSAEQVIEELKYLENLGYGAVYFDDGTFTTNRRRTIEISESIVRNNIRLEWGCQTRGDRIDRELLAAMAEAGCTYVFVGIESGSQKILDLLDKKLTLEESTRGVDLIKAAGLRVAVSIMLGTPHETNQDLDETFRYVNELKPDMVSLSLFALYPPKIAGEAYESKSNLEPIFLKFDEGYGSVHHVGLERAEELYEQARRELGNLIL